MAGVWVVGRMVRRVTEWSGSSVGGRVSGGGLVSTAGELAMLSPRNLARALRLRRPALLCETSARRGGRAGI